MAAGSADELVDFLVLFLKQNVFPTSKQSKRATEAEREEPKRKAVTMEFSILGLKKKEGFQFFERKEEKKKKRDRETVAIHITF